MTPTTNNKSTQTTLIARIKRRTAFLLRLDAAIEQQHQADQARRSEIVHNAVRRWQFNQRVREAKERKAAPNA